MSLLAATMRRAAFRRAGVLSILLAGLSCDRAPTSPPASGATVVSTAGAASLLGSPALTSSVDPGLALSHSALPMGNPKHMNEAGLIVGNCGGACGIGTVWTEASGDLRINESRDGVNCCNNFYGVNNLGEAIGIEGHSTCFCLILWSDATQTWTPVPTGQGANFLPRIDDHGDISFTNPGRPMFIHAGTPIVLPMAGFQINTGWANDHNNAGTIVGRAFQSPRIYAISWSSYLAAPTKLPTPTGNNAEALAINDAGDIVGWSEPIPGNSTRHATLWPATGGIVDLATWTNSCSGNSTAWAVNGNGVIAGECNGRAVIWTAVEGMRALADGSGNPVSGAARAINNALMIAAESPSGGLVGSLWKVADHTPPVVTATVTGTLGANGWYTSDVAVTWSVTDAESGIASTTGCDASTLTVNSAGTTYTCSATNAVGLHSAASVTIKRDADAPDVHYAGNLGTYDVDATVTITCSASDAFSGLASSSCADISGAAWSFGIGEHTYSAAATDFAGNTAEATVAFTVRATATGLCALTRAYVSSKGIANSLCVKLAAADRAAARGDSHAMAGEIAAFINEVRAMSGKVMSAADAAVLLQIAGQL